MAVSFTIYTWYDSKSPVQQANFRRWNRNISSGNEKFEVIVFFSGEIDKKSKEKYQNLRFWKLHTSMIDFPTSLLNEAIRYSRGEILMYVSPWALIRKIDLYCVANRVQKDYTMAWTGLKRCFLKSKKNFLINFLDWLKWYFQSGRLEFYAHLNSPFDFYDCGFFSFHKPKLLKIFSELEIQEKEKLISGDNSSKGALNFYFFHILKKYGAEVFNEGKLHSYVFGAKTPPVFYSYLSTLRLVQMSIKEKSFHYRVNIYRVLLPVMQMTQVAFFSLVWFYPLKSMSLIGFYIILASGIIVEIFLNKKNYRVYNFFLWFFSWLFV